MTYFSTRTLTSPCCRDQPTPTPRPRRISVKGPIEHCQESLAFNNLASVMVFEEKHRDSILTEAKCTHPTKPDPTTLGQQELGASLGKGMAVPAPPFNCWLPASIQNLASSALTGVVRIRECRQSSQKSTSPPESLRRRKPRFSARLGPTQVITISLQPTKVRVHLEVEVIQFLAHSPRWNSTKPLPGKMFLVHGMKEKATQTDT